MVITRQALIAERTAQAIWAGTLSSGHGSVRSGTGAIDDLPVTWATRIGPSNGKTSPEELAAAAHASCFSMALALRLGEHGVAPERLDVTASVSLGQVQGRPTVLSSTLSVSARVPELDATDFRAIVDEAAELCPISLLFAGAEITVDAWLVLS
ncbi:MAG: OsmC family peroxiredoxin [Candidatus Limnocylindrales bacterium]